MVYAIHTRISGEPMNHTVQTYEDLHVFSGDFGISFATFGRTSVFLCFPSNLATLLPKEIVSSFFSRERLFVFTSEICNLQLGDTSPKLSRVEIESTE